MFGITMALVALNAGPIELPKDVCEIETRSFVMPVIYDTKRRDTIQQIHLFVSTDQGKTWKLHKSFKPDQEGVQYDAERDGVVWFALQIQCENARLEPSAVNKLEPGQKVFVNTAKKR